MVCILSRTMESISSLSVRRSDLTFYAAELVSLVFSHTVVPVCLFGPRPFTAIDPVIFYPGLRLLHGLRHGTE